jgi:thiol-disulfide isomerase/thioredoxin
MRRGLAAVVVLIVVLVVGVATVWVCGRVVGPMIVAFAGRKTPPAFISRVGQVMPDFELVDLQGRTWHLADLKGKTTFVNVWATWCPPCRKELPHLQRLYERVKDRPDVVLLTMNVDETTSKVRPFLSRNGYTFPVVFADDYVRTQLGATGIPRNWVLDANGVLRFDEVGYGDGAGDWVANAERMIEETRAVQGTPQPKETAVGR